MVCSTCGSTLISAAIRPENLDRVALFLDAGEKAAHRV
jgi:hypothetical protein